MTFRDASLGKPATGRLYAQVITEGYEITLRAGGSLFIYHGAAGHVVFIGQASIPPANQSENTR